MMMMVVAGVTEGNTEEPDSNFMGWERPSCGRVPHPAPFGAGLKWPRFAEREGGNGGVQHL